MTVAAVSGAYTVGTDATITIAAGNTTAASDTVLVTAVDDSIHQGSAGRSVTVTAALANGQGAGRSDGGGADPDGRRDPADGGARVVVFVDFGDGRGFDGDGDLVRPVERGGDGDGGRGGGDRGGRGETSP